MLTFDVEFEFTGRYVAHPYWPEMHMLIEIQKKSGVNRARSEANRRKALEEHLIRLGMTLADYERLEKQAARPFHTAPDGEIIIPASPNVISFIVAANRQVRSAGQICKPGQERTRVIPSDFHTGKYEPDGIYSRFAVVTVGAGAKASNQRGLRENAYIEGFVARGAISIDETEVDPAALRQLLEWGGAFVGIGACRPMGCGRFRLARFEAVS